MSDAERLDPPPRRVEPSARMRGGKSEAPVDIYVHLAAVLARPSTIGDGGVLSEAITAAFGRPPASASPWRPGRRCGVRRPGSTGDRATGQGPGAPGDRRPAQRRKAHARPGRGQTSGPVCLQRPCQPSSLEDPANAADVPADVASISLLSAHLGMNFSVVSYDH